MRAAEAGTKGGALLAIHRAFVMLSLAAAVLAALNGLVTALELREPLAEHLGWGFRWLALAIAASVAVTGFAFMRRASAWRKGTWQTATGVEVRMLFSALVVAVAVVVLMLQPVRRVYLEFALALAGGGFASALLVLQPAMGATRSTLSRAFDFTLFNVCLIAFSSEVALRSWAELRPAPIFSRVDQGLVEFLDSFRVLSLRERWGFANNSRGYYDEELPSPARREAGERLVVAIGDSFSMGAVPHYLHYTTVCERELPGVVVDNIGVPGVGPPEYLHLLRTEALPSKPDAVVIALFIGNDIAFYDTRTLGRGGSYEWLDPEAFLILNVPRRLLQVRSERTARPDTDVGAVQAETAKPVGPLETWADHVREFPWVADPALEEASFSVEKFQTIERQRVRSTCNTADVSAYANLFAVLNEIRAAVRDVPLLFLLIPDEFQVEDDAWESAVEDLKGEALELDRRQPQRIIAAWLADRGAPFVDLLPDLRAVEPLPDGRRHVFHARDTHFNTRGNDVAGRALARALRELLPEGD